MAVLCKVLAGAALVVFIHYISMSKNYLLAALIPLFPTFTLIALYSVGEERTTAELQKTILFGMCSMLPYIVYLIAMYFLVTRYNLMESLLYSTGCWVIVALTLVGVWSYFEKREHAFQQEHHLAQLSEKPLLEASYTVEQLANVGIDSYPSLIHEAADSSLPLGELS